MGRRMRGLLRLRGLTLILRHLLRCLCSSSLLHAGIFLMVWMWPTLLIKDGVSFLITRWATELQVIDVNRLHYTWFTLLLD
jgi:hypothetical protein